MNSKNDVKKGVKLSEPDRRVLLDHMNNNDKSTLKSTSETTINVNQQENAYTMYF